MRFAMLLCTMAGVASSPALAGEAFTFKISNRVTEAQPSATVEAWAGFDENLYALAGTLFEFDASPDAGSLSDPHTILAGIGTKDGDVSQDGDSVTGIIAGQLHCPADCLIDTSNPILIWRVTWSTDDFAPRHVVLTTYTSKFDVYLDAQGTSMTFLDQLVEGSGLIEVGCYADCTNDGALDLFDFLCFVNQFNAGAPEADCDASGGLDLFDFLCFVNAFNGGC